MSSLPEEAASILREALEPLSFDQAVFFEHAVDDEQGNFQRLACPRFVFNKIGLCAAWSQRWQPERRAGVEWFKGTTPWVDDLNEVASNDFEEAGVKVGELAGVRQLLSSRIRSLLGFAVFADDGSILASLLLCSEQAAAYGPGERDLLHSAALAALMSKLLAELHRRRAQLVEEIRKTKFTPRVTSETIAKDLARTLAEANDWDFVGIYRVEDEFAMIASEDRTPDQRLQIDPLYRQPLNVGMLGETLRQRKCLRADDVDVPNPPYNYSKVEGFSARSALCYPISVNGRVAWILDCASVARSAFHGPDRTVLNDLVTELQSTLDLWFEIRLTRAMLDGISEPVLVADREGCIQRINRSAAELFGLEQHELPKRFVDLAHDERTRRKLSHPSLLSNDDVVLSTKHGEGAEFLASANLCSEAFGQFVIKLTSKTEQNWLAGLEVARKTVEGEASQSRVLLMLAAALIGRVRSDIDRRHSLDGAEKQLRRAAEAIEGADLGYDRIAGSLAGTTRHTAPSLVLNTLVDLAVRDVASLSDSGEAARRDVLASALKTVAEHCTPAGGSARASDAFGAAQWNRSEPW